MNPFFFFNDTATTEIYTLSLHDALPISDWLTFRPVGFIPDLEMVVQLFPYDRKLRNLRLVLGGALHDLDPQLDRKSTRLNSSHGYISYAVFCLKKKKKRIKHYEASIN